MNADQKLETVARMSLRALVSFGTRDAREQAVSLLESLCADQTEVRKGHDLREWQLIASDLAAALRGTDADIHERARTLADELRQVVIQSTQTRSAGLARDDADHDVALHAVASALRRLTTGDAERVAQLCYLADWRAAITLGRTLTGVRWTVTSSGPDTATVEAALARLPAFRPGGSYWLIQSADTMFLADETRAVVDHVVRETDPLRWVELSRLVRSTWPALKDVGVADLPALAIDKARFESRSA